MCILRHLILLCAILIYCGVQSHIVDSISVEDDAIPIKDAHSLKDSIRDSQYDGASTKECQKEDRRKIVGGVDDDREEIEKVCPISKVDSTPGSPKLSSPLECARTCNDNEKPKTCYYHFIAEYYSALSSACQFCNSNSTNAFCNNCQCVSVDGFERPIMTINRMIPGPSIDVCEGDTIVVDLSNKMEGEGLTIHWHGLFQRGTQHYDGVSMVTQCPIPEHTTFRYQFKADNAGTHLWHAHTGLQKMDGIFGRLTIRQSPKRDVNSHLYDFDLSRHGIIINDWMHELAVSRLPGRLRSTNFGSASQNPDSILINGKGRYKNPITGNSTDSELQVFHVKPNYRYRFRLVNALCTVCASILTVEGHNLTVIAVDGVSVKPTVVNSIVSVTGERFDFVINANKQVNSYWIQLRATTGCENLKIQQLAILEYDGVSNDVPSTPAPTFDSPLPQGIVLGPLDDQCSIPRNDAVCVSNLQSAVPVDKDIFRKHPDVKLYLPFAFYAYDLQNLFAPNNFQSFIVSGGFFHTVAIVDNISLLLPPSPPLTQFKDIPPDMICDGTQKPKDCNNVCSCVHIIDLPYNGIIEIIIVDETGIPGLYHPFHLHGYAFNIMGMAAPNNGTGVTVEEIKQMDKEGLLPRRTSLPPFKDTVVVPNNGYAIIRFRADNPGYWFFHCHFIYHLSVGMGNIFRIEQPNYRPRIPRNFPKCGKYLPRITP